MRRWIGEAALALLLAGAAGCGKRIPSEVIQPAEMEDLLYDYHLATSLGTSLPYDESYKKEAYLAYVFRKHGVTQAEFDSSMVWYTRHGSELAELYKQVGERFRRDEERMKAQTARRGSQIDVSVSGDTVDVWQDRTFYWLTSSVLTNRLVFSLKADTTFHPDDAMALQADVCFIPRATASQQEATVVMGLRFQFDNDSVRALTRVVASSGTQQLVVTPDSSWQLKNVSGFIYYQPGPSAEGPESGVLLNRLQLMRYHRPAPAKTMDAPTEHVTAEEVAEQSVH